MAGLACTVSRVFSIAAVAQPVVREAGPDHHVEQSPACGGEREGGRGRQAAAAASDRLGRAESVQ